MPWLLDFDGSVLVDGNPLCPSDPLVGTRLSPAAGAVLVSLPTVVVAVGARRLRDADLAG